MKENPILYSKGFNHKSQGLHQSVILTNLLISTQCLHLKHAQCNKMHSLECYGLYKYIQDLVSSHEPNHTDNSDSVILYY